MALIAHTFRIEQETLDELERMGDGNASFGARLALSRARDRQARTFAWGAVAGFLASAIAHLAIVVAMTQY